MNTTEVKRVMAARKFLVVSKKPINREGLKKTRIIIETGPLTACLPSMIDKTIEISSYLQKKFVRRSLSELKRDKELYEVLR